MVRPGTNRVRVWFRDGTRFDKNLPTPERLRKGTISSTELGLLAAYYDLCLLKIGDRRVLPGGYGKWHKRAIARWSETYRRKGGKQPAANKRSADAAEWKAAEIKAGRDILGRRPEMREVGASWLAQQVVKLRVSPNKFGTIRKHLRCLFE
jgi:hypothetical protein